jgi:hypothetical protein
MHDTTTLLPSVPSEQKARLVMWSWSASDEWSTAEDPATIPGHRPTEGRGGTALHDAPRGGTGGRATAHAPATEADEGEALRGGIATSHGHSGDAPSAPSGAPGCRRSIACAGASCHAPLIPLPLGVQEAHGRRVAAGARERRGCAAGSVVDVAMAGATDRVSPWRQSPLRSLKEPRVERTLQGASRATSTSQS